MHVAVAVLLLTTAAVLGSACSDGTTAALSPGNPARDVSGPYRYLAYDSAGVLLLQGELMVAPVDDSTLTGTWMIHWVADVDTTRPVGPQVGAGILGGTRAGHRWQLTLTPGWADNNVDLVAVAREGDLAGAWTHSTITGPKAGGSFHALRQ
jgi:hypothetical protein